jgi:hypothetical protein
MLLPFSIIYATNFTKSDMREFASKLPTDPGTAVLVIPHWKTYGLLSYASLDNVVGVYAWDQDVLVSPKWQKGTKLAFLYEPDAVDRLTSAHKIYIYGNVSDLASPPPKWISSLKPSQILIWDGHEFGRFR